MSGQHSPNDTGREENPAETDRSGKADEQSDAFWNAPAEIGFDPTAAEPTLASVVTALNDVERVLRRIAENQWEIIKRQDETNVHLNRLAQRH